MGFAVVIPTFQPGPFLMETLASIARQTVPPEEIVVVDDGSEPPVSLSLTEMPARLVRLPHSGIAAARNAGIGATSAPVVHVCDHDDILEPTFYERQAAAFTGAHRIDIAFSFCGFINELGAVIPGRLPWEAPRLRTPHESLRTLLRGNQMASVAATFRREVFGALGGFHSFDYVQDWEFWLRAAAGGYRFTDIPEVLAWHRVHIAQQSSEARRIPALEESLLMLKSLHVSPRFWADVRRARAGIHLHLSRLLRSANRPGVARHVLGALRGRPIETSRLLFGIGR